MQQIVGGIGQQDDTAKLGFLVRISIDWGEEVAAGKEDKREPRWRSEVAGNRRRPVGNEASGVAISSSSTKDWRQ